LCFILRRCRVGAKQKTWSVPHWEAQKIYGQVVATKAMPIGNLTGMTDEERAKIAAWLAAGATQP
jgi:uncharacterized membrane protein